MQADSDWGYIPDREPRVGRTPAPRCRRIHGAGDFQVDLLRPDDNRVPATSRLATEFLHPSPASLAMVLCVLNPSARWMFRSAGKSGAMKSFSWLLRLLVKSMNSIQLETDLQTRSQRLPATFSQP